MRAFRIIALGVLILLSAPVGVAAQLDWEHQTFGRWGTPSGPHVTIGTGDAPSFPLDALLWQSPAYDSWMWWSQTLVAPANAKTLWSFDLWLDLGFLFYERICVNDDCEALWWSGGIDYEIPVRPSEALTITYIIEPCTGHFGCYPEPYAPDWCYTGDPQHPYLFECHIYPAEAWEEYRGFVEVSKGSAYPDGRLGIAGDYDLKFAATFTTTPEPSILVLLGPALLAIGAAVRRRRRALAVS